MPERQITKEQRKAVEDWVSTQNAEEVSDSVDDGFDSKLVRKIWSVDSEPLLIYMMQLTERGMFLKIGERSVIGREQTYLLCSDKHAAGLEQAGIINFANPNQGAQTP